MNPPHHNHDSLPDDDPRLNAALRAAFGPATTINGAAAHSVLATLDRTVAPCHRILLRDTADEAATIIRPSGRCESRPAAVGRYQIVGEIARGGVGVVLKSRDVDLGRDVAMKVLRPDLAHSGSMVQRFIEEAQIAGQLQHPGILPVYELGLSDDRRPYFTMRLVRGSTLSTLLAERPDATHDRTRLIDIFASVCQAVAYAHAKGVIHRDLKPSNVLVGSFGEVQVVDWGLAKVIPRGGLADDVDADDTVIETVRSGEGGTASLVGSVMGTPAYMSPEQARGEVRTLDERSDVFSLGAILCEILTGQPPYTGAREAALALAARGDTSAARARLAGCHADPELIDLTGRCLAPEVSHRPRDAGAVAREITAYQESLAERARQLEITAARAAEQAAGERRARRLTVALATTIVAAIVLIGGGSIWVQQARQARVTQNTSLLEQAVQSTSLALGRAQAAPPGQSAPWTEALSAAARIEQLLAAGEVADDARGRAVSLLAEVDLANRDRQLIDRIEDVVIVGATHEDAESWLWMAETLLKTFREYGIDIERLAPDEVAERIRTSRLSQQLTDGLELWIATEFHLHGLNAGRIPVPELLGKVELLYAADTDEFRTALRRLIYTGRPDLDEVRKLEQRADFENMSPRTLSWLATAYGMSGDIDGAARVFRRALLTYPYDFMLNFDFAYHLVPAGRWHEAIRCYDRAIAIRPASGGAWRGLGNALRQIDDLPGAMDALHQSVRFQPDHAPTYVDLAAALRSAGRLDEALAAVEQAVHLDAELALAYCERGHILRALGRLDEALTAFERCHELGIRRADWRAPSAEWLEECRRELFEAADPADNTPAGCPDDPKE